jgi:cell division protein FtsX
MSNEVTQEQFTKLGDHFDKGVDEIKNLLRSFDDRIRAIELQQASTYPLVNSQIISLQAQQTSTQIQVDEIRRNISTQVKSQTELSQSISTITNWGKWLAGIVTALISSGLVFFIGRLIILSLTGNLP